MRHALAPKTASWIRYWDLGSPSRTKADGFRTVLVYCVGLVDLNGSYHNCCQYNGRLKPDDLPDRRWQDISAHLKCTKCGTVGCVDTRLNSGEVINFNKGIGI
jgi:hypothetical protein